MRVLLSANRPSLVSPSWGGGSAAGGGKARSSLKRSRADVEEDSTNRYNHSSTKSSNKGKSIAKLPAPVEQEEENANYNEGDEVDDDATITPSTARLLSTLSASTSAGLTIPLNPKLKKITDLASDPQIERALHMSSPHHAFDRPSFKSLDDWARSVRNVEGARESGDAEDVIEDFMSSPGPQRKIRRSL